MMVRTQMMGLVLAAVLLSGCTLVDVRKDVDYSFNNGAMPSDVINAIEVGKTRRQWLTSNLGAPHRILEDPTSGDTTFVYQYKERQQGFTKVLLVFRYRVTKVIPHHLYISLRDQVVTRVWDDEKDATSSKMSDSDDNSAPQSSDIQA